MCFSFPYYKSDLSSACCVFFLFPLKYNSVACLFALSFLSECGGVPKCVCWGAESFHSPNIASAVTQHPELVPSSSVKFVLPLLIKLSKKEVSNFQNLRYMWALLWSLLMLKIFRFMSHKSPENHWKPSKFWEFVCGKTVPSNLILELCQKCLQYWVLLFKFGLWNGVPGDRPFVNKGKGRSITGLVSHVLSFIKIIPPPHWKVAKTKKKSLTFKSKILLRFAVVFPPRGKHL